MNSGAGAVTINSPVTLGAGQTWTNNSSSPLAVAGNVTNGGNTLAVTGSGNTTISGTIAGAGGLSAVGTGKLVLAAANSYTAPRASPPARSRSPATVPWRPPAP